MRLGLEPHARGLRAHRASRARLSRGPRRRHQRQGQRLRDGRVDRARRGAAHRPLHLAAPLPLRRAHPGRRRADRATRRSRSCSRARSTRGPISSFFETATLAAFLAFREAKVDLAVVEVGLGGRLDATNVIPAPRAAAITRIALDHTDRLGDTLEAIAREKAGIAKPGLDLLLGDDAGVVRAAIDEVAARRRRHDVARAETSRSSKASGSPGLTSATTRASRRRSPAGSARRPRAIERGLSEVRWPGRLERIGERAARRRAQPRRRQGPRRVRGRGWGLLPRAWRSCSARSPTRTGPPCSTRSPRSPRARVRGAAGRLSRHGRLGRHGRAPPRQLRRLARGGARGSERRRCRPARAARAGRGLRLARARRPSARAPARPAVRSPGRSLKTARPCDLESGPRHAELRHRLEGRTNEVDNALEPGPERDRAALRLQGHRDRAREERRRHHRPLVERRPREGRPDRAAARSSSSARCRCKLHRSRQAREDGQGRRARSS